MPFVNVTNYFELKLNEIYPLLNLKVINFKQTVLDYYRLQVPANLINGIGLACVAGWSVKEL